MNTFKKIALWFKDLKDLGWPLLAVVPPVLLGYVAEGIQRVTRVSFGVSWWITIALTCLVLSGAVFYPIHANFSWPIWTLIPIVAVITTAMGLYLIWALATALNEIEPDPW